MKKNKDILELTKKDQYRTVDELFTRSQAGSIYKVLLVLSTIIVAAGLLLGNSPIVIGGMVITPVLSPILAVALSVAVGKFSASKKPIILAVKSFITVIVISFFLAIFLGVPENSELVFANNLRTAILYFTIAITSGVAATLGWARKEIADILPGIAIAVSLVPPLSLVGIWLSALNFANAQFFLFVFLFNLIGIFIGSVIVFIALDFERVEERVEKIEKEQEKISNGN